MRIGVISDSHGNLTSLLDTIDFLFQFPVDRIFFLGHDLKDIEKVLELKEAILKAHKKYDEESFIETLGDFLLKEEKKGSSVEDEISWLKKNLVAIPGEGEPELRTRRKPDKEFEMVGGRILLLVHQVKSLSKEDIASAGMILYGATHKRKVDEVAGRYFINPGHLMAQPYRGEEGSFAILFLGEDPRVEFYSLRFQLLEKVPLHLEKKRKLTVQ